MRWLLLACVRGCRCDGFARHRGSAGHGGSRSRRSSAGTVADAATYVGKPVEQVRVFVDGQPTADAAITDLLETHVGSPLAMADVRESIAHLYSLGRFQDVRVDAGDLGRAASACASTSCRSAACEDVEFTGTLGLDKGLLRRTIADRYGARPPVARGRRRRRARSKRSTGITAISAPSCGRRRSDVGGRRQHRADCSRSSRDRAPRSPT